MNKIYRTVYNETTNTWVAVEETAKSHRKSSGGVVDSTPTSACERVSGSLKLRGLTAAVAIALFSPLAVSPAFAEINGDFNQRTDGSVTWGGGTVDPSTANATAFSGGKVTAGAERAVAWGNGTAQQELSTAWGDGTFASGGRATAWGDGTVALGQRSTAWGEKTAAQGSLSTAFGTGTLAGSGGRCYQNQNGKVVALKPAIVKDACDLIPNAEWVVKGVSGKGDNATAWGLNTIAGNDQATAFGSDSIANGENSTAFGENSYAYADNSLAALGGQVGLDTQGANNTAHSTTGLNSVAIGKGAWVQSDNSVAWGKDSVVNQNATNSLAAMGGRVGSENATSGTSGNFSSTASLNAIAIGSGAVADYSSFGPSTPGGITDQDKPSGNVAIGVNTHAEGAGTVAIGGQTGSNGAYAQNGGSIAIGAKAEAVGATLLYSSGTNPAKGSNSEYGRDLNTANWGLGTKPSQMIAVGDSAAAYGDQSTAIGANTIAAGTSAIAMGGDDLGRADKLTEKPQFQNIQDELGELKKTLDDNGYEVPTTLKNTLTKGATAYADLTLAKGDASMAIGQKAVAEGHLSNALGAMARSKGDNSNAIGTASVAGADNSIAMGSVATTGEDATQSTAIGYMAQTGGEIVLGDIVSLQIDPNDKTKGTKKFSVNGEKEQELSELGSVKIDDKGVEHKGVHTGTGVNSVAVGEHNKVLGDNSTAVGQGNIIIGNNSGAFGDPNVIIGNDSKATGNNNVVAGHHAFVMGNDVTNTAHNSIFLGTGSSYTKAKDDLTADDAGSTAGMSNVTFNDDGSIASIDESSKYESNAKDIKVLEFDADGNAVLVDDGEGGKTQKTSDTVAIKAGNLKFAGANAAGVVSVGDVGKERRIQNVAAGLIDEKSTDAINGSQLYSVIQNLKPETTPVTPDSEKGIATYTPETYLDKDGNPLTKNEDGTYNNADGSPYTGDVTTVNNGNKLVTAGDVVNTINNVYWSVDAKQDGNNADPAYNIKAGNLVDLVGDGVAIDQEWLKTDVNGNKVMKVEVTEDDGTKTEKWYQVKLDKYGNVVVENGKEVADTSKEVQAADLKDTAKFTFKADTTKITDKDGLAFVDNVYTTPNGTVLTLDGKDEDGKPIYKDGDKNVYKGDVIDSGSRVVTANDVRDTINNVYWNIDAKQDGNNDADPYQIKAGNLVDLVGDGVDIDQEWLKTDGKGNEVIKVTEDDGTEKWYQVKLDDKGKKVADTDKEVQAANVKDTAKFTFKAETAQQPVVYTDADGNKLTKNDAGKWVKPQLDEKGEPVLDDDGKPKYDEVNPADVIASMNNGGDSTTTPMTLDNIASNLEPSTSDGVLIGQDGSATFNGKPVTKVGDKWFELKDGKPTTTEVTFKDGNGNSLAKPSTEMKAPANALAMNNKAATVGDVLNAGWNLQGNGTAVDFVKPYDTVNFINGAGTTATVTSDGLVSKVTYNVNPDNKTTQITYVDASGNPVVKNGDDWYKADDIGKDGKPKDGTSPVNEENVSSQVVAKTTPLTMEQDSNKKPTGKVVTPADDVKDSLVTAGDVANAINQSGWKVKGSGNPADGNSFTTELINPGEEVELIAGEGLKLKQNGNKFEFSADIDQDGNSKTKLTSEQTKAPTAGDDGKYGTYTDGNIQLALKHDKDSDTDTFDVKLNKDVTLGDNTGAGSLNVSDKKDGDKPVANTEIKPNEINFTDAGDNNTGKITGLGSHLADGSTDADGNPITSNPNGDLSNVQNQAATVGDVLNAGWNLQAEGKAVDFVTHGDTVNFASSNKTVTITDKSADGKDIIDFVVNTDGKTIKPDSNGVLSVQTDGDTIIAGDNGLKVNTGGSQVGDNGKAAPKNGDTNKIATVGDITDTINGVFWKVDASGNGSNAANANNVKAGHQVNFVGGDGVQIDQTNADATTTFTFKVDDSTLNTAGVHPLEFTGDDPNAGKLTPTHGGMVQIKGGATTGTSAAEENVPATASGKNITVNPNGDALEVALAPNVDLGDKGSLKVGKDDDNVTNITPEGVNVANKDNNTNVAPDQITFADKDGNSSNTGSIIGLASHLQDPTGKTENPDKTGKAYDDMKNQAATVEDVLNAGWNLQAEGKAVDFVTHGDTVNFASSDKSVSISGSTGSTVDFKVNKAENYTANDDGTISAPTPEPITNADGTTTTPAQFWDATQTADAINNAAWQITSSTAGDDVQKVKAGDKVDLKAGKGITIEQSSTDFTFSTNLKGENGIEVVDNDDGSQTIKYTGKGDGNRKTTVTNTDGNLVVTPNLKDDNNHIYDVALNNTITVGNEKDGDKPITIDGKTGDITLGGDTGGNINNVANHINPDGSMIDPAAPTNQAATVQDVLNSGWNVKVGDADPEYIKHGEQVAFIDGKGTKVSGSKDGIAYDINVDQNSPLSINNDGALTVDVGGFDNTTDGSVKANNPNGLATAGDIANAVNNSGWNVTTSASTGEVSGTSKELIKPTNTVTFDAGDNIRIVQSGNQISVGTTRNINVAGNLNVAGDTTVNNLAVNPGANVDMGGNQIHNVAPGIADTDAVNVSQLRQAVGNGGQDWNPRINQVENHANAGTAQAIATAGLPQVYLPGKNLIAIGGGVYRGESGYAVGFSSISDNGSWIFKATGSGNSRGNFGGSAAVGYQW